MSAQHVTEDMGNMLTWEELIKGASNIQYDEMRDAIKQKMDVDLIRGLMIHISFKPLKVAGKTGLLRLKLTGVNSQGQAESVYLYKSPSSNNPEDPMSWSPTRFAVAFSREMFELKKSAGKPSSIAISLGFATEEVQDKFSEMTTYSVGLADVQAACHLAQAEPAHAEIRLSEMLAVCFARDAVSSARSSTADSWVNQMLKSASARGLMSPSELERIMGSEDFIEKSAVVTAASLKRGARTMNLPDSTQKLMGDARDRIMALTVVKMGGAAPGPAPTRSGPKIVLVPGLAEAPRKLAISALPNITVQNGKIVAISDHAVFKKAALAEKIPMWYKLE